jgi:hypothetical protein
MTSISDACTAKIINDLQEIKLFLSKLRCSTFNEAIINRFGDTMDYYCLHLFLFSLELCLSDMCLICTVF